MRPEENYLALNRKLWNDKVAVHLKSGFYDMESFCNGRSSLMPIELELLGDLRGKNILHLQCHFGQDTISLSRMGAHATGVDFSDEAIQAATRIASQMDADTRFVCCDVYDLPNHLDEKFDVVFTSYGTIGWLPDLDRWAKVVSHFLLPSGKFVFAEFHPVLWMFDPDFTKVHYPYFNAQAIVEETEGTYADRSAPIKNLNVNWNHSTSDVINSLIKNGLSLERFDEYDYSPYDCFNGTIEVEPGKYRIAAHGDKLPMVFALTATKS